VNGVNTVGLFVKREIGEEGKASVGKEDVGCSVSYNGAVVGSSVGSYESL